jgi:hypothetical protein
MWSFCPRCGTKRVGNFRFCRSCGFDFDRDEQERDSTQESPTASPVVTASPVQPPPPVVPVPRVDPIQASAPTTSRSVTRSAVGGASRWWRGLSRQGKFTAAVLAVLLLAGLAAAGSPPKQVATGAAQSTATPTAAANNTAVTSPPAAPLDTPEATKSGCDAAFVEAAAIDDMQDTVEDLDPAVRTCATADEWSLAAASHPGAIAEGVDPIEFLTNRCLYGEGLADTTLCRTIGVAAATRAPTARPRTLLDLKGSGIRRSKRFTATGDWTITYSYDCSSFGSAGNFIGSVHDSGGGLVDLLASELGKKGSGTLHGYLPGTYYLEMNSECSWHVKVTG